MRTAEQWFDLYGESHRNPTNKLIHWVCIPVILLSTLGLIQAIPFPVDAGPLVHWGTLVVLAGLVFYARLSLTIFVGMSAVCAVCLGINAAIVEVGLPLWAVSAGLFLVAWVAQFIGHKIEGKKPSFFQDLQFLLVGPAWLLQFTYRSVGIPVTLRSSAPNA